MDCLYLGGMLAMSSTTIIYKAFDDLGLRQQRFAGLVLSILIFGRYIGYCFDGYVEYNGSESEFRGQ